MLHFDTVCTYEGCERTGRITRGLCDKHYARLRSSEKPSLRRRGDKTYYSATRSGARRRGLEFALTPHQYLSITRRQCVYGFGRDPEIHIGIDRRDNRLGYTVENSQPCCARHNEIKSSVFTHEEMLHIVASCPSAVKCGNTRGGRPKLPVPTAMSGPRKYAVGPPRP